MLRRKIAGGAERDRLLRAHHDGVDEPAQQHHQAKQNVHDADSLVVDAGDPLAPEVGQMTLEHDPSEHREDDQHHDRAGNERDRLVPWDCLPGQLAEHVTAPSADERPRRASDVWARAGRELLGHDRIEQARIDRAIGERTSLAGSAGKRGITVRSNADPLWRAVATHCAKCVLGHGTHHEIHVGKSVAAVLARIGHKIRRACPPAGAAA